MPRYRHRPIEVDSNQFFEDKRWPLGVHRSDDGETCVVRTSHGDTIPLRNGDWIVPQPGGGAYPVADELFRQLWEPVKPCACGGYCDGKGC